MFCANVLCQGIAYSIYEPGAAGSLLIRMHTALFASVPSSALHASGLLNHPGRTETTRLSSYCQEDPCCRVVTPLCADLCHACQFRAIVCAQFCGCTLSVPRTLSPVCRRFPGPRMISSQCWRHTGCRNEGGQNPVCGADPAGVSGRPRRGGGQRAPVIYGDPCRSCSSSTGCRHCVACR